MKLKNKILPFATLVATASVITPIAVSCGNSLNSKREIVGLTVDIDTMMKKGYTRTIEPSSLTKIPWGTATQTYLKALADNKDLFAEDLFDFWGNMNRSEQLIPLPTGTTGTVTVGNVEVDQTNYTLSYALQFKANVPTKVHPGEGGGGEFEFTSICDLTLEVKKVPVYCEYQGVVEMSNFNLWLMIIDFESLWSLATDWSINLNGTIDLVCQDTQGHMDVGLKLDEESDEMSKFLETIGVGAYLLHPVSFFKNAEVVL